MPHINIRPFDRRCVYETAEQAMNHLLAHCRSQEDWDYGNQAWGRTIEQRRAVMRAIERRDPAAFTASRRRGYWRIELA